MADPTIQTFCCHIDANTTLETENIMGVFDSNIYNGVCMTSSALGMIGAIYQILPREQYSSSHRWLSFSATRGRKIIIWLAVADFLAALGVFTRASLWMRYKNIMPALNDGSSVLFCAISSAWTQYFYTATWFWTLCYAIDMRYVLQDKKGYIMYYHLVSWVLPIILTLTGLCLLYIPDADCHSTSSLSSATLRILPNYIVTYLPIATVMIVNPVLYKLSTQDMERIITSSHGQFTVKERDVIDAIKIKFFMIIAVFYFCWLPNFISGILLWTLWFNLPVKAVVCIWYIMAFTNPLQALLNSIVYRRWTKGSERVVFPCRQLHSLAAGQGTRISSQCSVRDESLPLLREPPESSINGSS